MSIGIELLFFAFVLGVIVGLGLLAVKVGGYFIDKFLN